MSATPLERFLDSARNPWRYVWRCAVKGHRLNHDGQVRPGDVCTRCGQFQPLRIERKGTDA